MSGCVATLAALLLSLTVGHAQSPTPNRNYDVLIAGNGEDVATGVALSDAGDVYITGTVSFDDFPTTPGAYRDVSGAGVFVSRLNPDASVGFTAALSGARGEAIAVDDSGIYVAGYDFNWPARAFVAKLSADGSQLLYRTTLGPLGDYPVQTDGGSYPRLSLAIDAGGQAYVAGTAGAGFQAKGPALDSTLGGAADGFVAIVDAGGTVSSATFIGGSDRDEISGIVVDSATGAVTVTGNTGSLDFPVSANTMSPASDGGAFVLSFTGTTVNYSTVVGFQTTARRIARGSNGTVWLTGLTRLEGFPIRTAAGDSTLDSYDPRTTTFVMQLSAAGDRLYSNLLMPPGSGDREYEMPGTDRAISIAVDEVPGKVQRVIVVGESNADRSYFAPEDNAFAYEFDLLKNTARYTESLGGARDEAFFDVAVNGRGDTVFVGFTTSYYTSNEFGWGYPDMYLYGRDVTAPPDEEMGDLIPADIIIRKRVAPERVAGNTPAGDGIVVEGPVSGTTVTFSNVVATGETSIVPISDPSSLNLSLPGAFAISTTSAAYEITTTATVSGPIEVCLVASGMTDAEFANASILHGVGGAWQVETTRRDLATHRLCADVTSFSPFAVGKLVDTTAPQIACGQAPAGWQAENVTIACTASDSGSGLAWSADASFTLSTSVAPGTETASAVTGTRGVCDGAGNCATAGPIAGIRIDRRGPAVQIASPASRRYLLAENVSAAYTCGDNGAGVASCAGPVTPGAAIDTTAVGSRLFTVTAADRVGNMTAAQAEYTVGYGITVLYDETRAFKAGSAVNLQVALVDAGGRNVSSAAVTLSVRKLTRREDGWTMPLGAALPFVAKSSSYGGKVDTSGLSAGTYDVELEAAGDAGVLKVRFTLK